MLRFAEQRLTSFEVLDSLLLPPEMHTLIRLRAPRLEPSLFRQLGFDSRFDSRLAKAVVKAASALFRDCPDVVFCYLGRMELTFLLELDTFRNRRAPWELVADLSALTSAHLSLGLGTCMVYHARIYQFPTAELAEDYFAWQQELTRHDALVHHYVQLLAQRGVDIGSAQQMVGELDSNELVEVLRESELPIDSIPAWQRAGTGLYRQEPGSMASLLVDTQLPEGEGFRAFIHGYLT